MTNDGTILLESANNNYQSDIATGSHADQPRHHQLGAGTGGKRLISGTLDNQATVDATADYLDITGTYVADGGTITGPGYLVNCTLQETAAPASPSTIVVAGQGVTLATDNLAGYTLWVQGSNHYGDAVLTLAGSVSNTARSSCSPSTTPSSEHRHRHRHADQRRQRHDPDQRRDRRRSDRDAARHQRRHHQLRREHDLRELGGHPVNTGLMSIAGATVTVVGSSFTNELGGLVSGYGTFNTSGVTLTNNGISTFAAEHPRRRPRNRPPSRSPTTTPAG